MRALVGSSASIFLSTEYGVATLFTAVAARLRRRRMMIFQEHVGRQGLSLPWWEQCWRRMLNALAHGAVANTDAAYLELIDGLAVDSRKVFRATLLVAPWRKRLTQEPIEVPTPTHRPVFLFVGRLIASKNIAGLVDAAIALNTRGFSLEVWIVGDGPQRADLEARARGATDLGVVHFLGSLSNEAVGPIYKTADVFVMPSFQEYRSVAVLEALRFGTPVIDSNCDGNAGDSVRDGLTGLIFDPHAAGGLESAMERTITDVNLRQQLRRQATAVMDEHTPETAAIALRDIIASI